nr:SAM-dependent methyltransferase [Planobispora longispora]
MWLPWRAAMERALYGEDGFYLRERPSGHFRTSVGASPVFAEALARELVEVDRALGRPAVVDLVDIGAGEGMLAAGVMAAAPSGLRARLRVTAVDLAPRPARLPGEIVWTETPPEKIHGLVVANEWLDNVPVDIAEQTPQGPGWCWSTRRPVRSGWGAPGRGRPRLAGPLVADAGGGRAGGDRQAARRGLGVGDRTARPRAGHRDRLRPPGGDRPPYGTLAGYRDGASVAPVPDGSCDVTAHVALDACAAAGERAGAVTTALTTQRAALRALGVTGARPPAEFARTDPSGYLRALARASEEAELIAPDGLGGFGWLVQSRL